MSNDQVDVEITEKEPTLEQIEKEAAKQLLSEMFLIQQRVYNIAMNSMLLVQLKQITRGLMSKYKSIGVFSGENIDVKFVRRLNTVEFVPTPGLKNLFTQISNELAEQAISEQSKEKEEKEHA